MNSPTRNIESLLLQCIHCGLCLTACPTYRLSGDEADSPRGRLRLLAELLDPDTSGEDFDSQSRVYLDRCLVCLSCRTACPSGVSYGRILEMGREKLGIQPGYPAWIAWLVDELFSHPTRLALADPLGRRVENSPLAGILPGFLRRTLENLPDRSAHLPDLRTAVPRRGLDARPSIALLSGCAQQVYDPRVLDACLMLVEATGHRACVPAGQVCCGALSAHGGQMEKARDLARRNIDAFSGFDTVLIPSAGRSAHMRDYGHLMAEDPGCRMEAEDLAARSEDILCWLDRHADQLSFRPDSRKVVYHSPCHHQHAQAIDGPAFRLLERIPSLEILEISHPEQCCGSGGSFSLLQPQIARKVRQVKLETISEVGPDFLLTANPGCELFLESGLKGGADPLPIMHLVVYLAQQLKVTEEAKEAAGK